MKKDSAQIPTRNTGQSRVRDPRSSAESAERTTVEDVIQDPILTQTLNLVRGGVREQDLARVLVFNLLLRMIALFGKIEESFLGQPLVREVLPDAPANQRRINAYLDDYSRATKLSKLVVELVGITNEMTAEGTVSTPQRGQVTQPAKEGQLGNLASNKSPERDYQSDASEARAKEDSPRRAPNSSKVSVG